MKAQAKEERARKMAERDRLERETQGRIEAERRQAELEERLVEMEEEARRAHEERLQAQRIVELLSEKVKLAEEEAQVSSGCLLSHNVHMHESGCMYMYVSTCIFVLSANACTVCIFLPII